MNFAKKTDPIKTALLNGMDIEAHSDHNFIEFIYHETRHSPYKFFIRFNAKIVASYKTYESAKKKFDSMCEHYGCTVVNSVDTEN